MATTWIPPISFGDLVGMAQSFPQQFPSVRCSAEAMQYAMAATVLRIYVGDQWCDKNLVGAEEADSYLIPKSEDLVARMKVQARIAALGEMLFNLQHIPNARTRFTRIRNSSLEVAVSDLEAARLLSLSECTYLFVDEKGAKGQDYDIELYRDSGATLCCESKCKLGETDLSEDTIFNSFRKAVAQLPLDVPGVVFMKLPESWIRSSTISDVVEAALHKSFEKSGRVVEVVLHWEEWHTMDSGQLLRLAKYREEVNRHSRHFDESLAPFLRPWSPIWNPPSWKTFVDAITSAGFGAR